MVSIFVIFLPITTSFKDLLLRNAFLPIEVTLYSTPSIVTVLGMITFFFVLSLLPVYLIVGVFFEADVTIYLFPFFFNFDPFGSLFWLSLACGCFDCSDAGAGVNADDGAGVAGVPGAFVGTADGSAEGTLPGFVPAGVAVGPADGTADGLTVGVADGVADGLAIGVAVGVGVGVTLIVYITSAAASPIVTDALIVPALVRSVVGLPSLV